MNFNPNWVSVPGDTIKSILEVKGYSIDQFSQKINKSRDYVEGLINGYERIDYSIADLLSSSLGFKHEFWILREKAYREKLESLEREWVSNLPIKGMVSNELIPRSSKVDSSKICLDFFGVKSFVEWNKRYKNQIAQFAFRKSSSFETNLYSVAVWFRQAEIFVEKLKVNTWDTLRFENKLPEIKRLTREKNPSIFLPKLVEFCADCGVHIAIVRCLEGNRASGATKFLNGQPLIILSFRYLSDDHFWFTFFHEAGHLILHADNKLRLELDTNMNDEEEREANLFAQACLIPEHLEERLHLIPRNKRSIVKISQEAEISPGILIGQMQHRGIISKGYLNSYKRYYSLENINEAIQIVQKNTNH